MTSIVLDVHNIGKRYTRYASNVALFASWFGLPVVHTHEFWALRDFSVTLRCRQLPQRDPGQRMLFSSGSRAMQTFRKEPTAVPHAKMKTSQISLKRTYSSPMPPE